jgi:A/G-specific adenine glycosylase
VSSEKPTETESEISELIHRLHQLPSPLLDWYSQQKRDLPWRADRDPYRIWVSEVMLQQTRVDTVIPYFSRLIAAYPDICSLAHADEQSLLRIWEGLGYYRRARDLRAAACLLRDNHAGRFPQDPAIVLSLPGFGRYTTNAVLSQAFDLRLPILEANTLRLLSRLIGSEEDPRQGAANRKLWHIAEAILPERDVGEFNQALMELGALVCLPTP